MISTYPDIRAHEFLILNYAEMGFIINRDQLCSSLFLEQATPFESAVGYVSSRITYRDQALPVFEFDTLLTDLFGCTLDSPLKLALISGLASFSTAHRAAYQAQVLAKYPELSEQYLALRVNINAEIKPLPLAEIRFIPSSLRDKQMQEGILGCRFPAGDKIQYFLDLETLVMNWLAKREAAA